MSSPRDLPIVNLTTDSEDSEDDVHNSFIVSSNTIPASLNLKETTPKSTCSCKCNHTVAQVDPLFRVIFKDEQTAKKYRLRIEDILRYVLTSKINDENSESSLTDLVLEVYDPAAPPTVNTHSPRVKKKVQTELSSNNHTQYQQPINYVNPTVNIDKRIKQEKIAENEKKRKISAQIPETLPSSNHHDSLGNGPQLQKRIKVEPTKENESNVQPEPSLKQAHQNGTTGPTIHNKNSSLNVMYQKILEQEYLQENINLETCFENSSVQIGSYGYFHRDKSIFLSKDGLTSFVPPFRGRKPVILSIEIDDITKVFTCFSETKPALFFYVTKKAAEGIRALLRMDDPNGPYIDAGSMNPIHQRIAISPLKISNESKQIIMQLFKNTQMIQITEVHAESLLARENSFNTSTELLPQQTSTGESHSANDLINESKSSYASDSSLHINTHQAAMSNNKNFREIFFSRVLRIGTFEYCKRRICSMDIDSIKICVPHLVNVSSIVTVNIKIEKIIKLRICFSETCPVIFIYLGAEAAEKIKTAIGMKVSNGSCFDPDSADESCNKIIILPRELSENCKIVQELSKIGLIEKLDEEVANKILTHSFSRTNKPEVPKESNDGSKKNLRVSFQSNSLRIGTYKCVQLQINVVISSSGLNINAPKVGSTVFKSITVPFNEITKVYYSFKKVFVLFFCISVSCAQTIRYILDIPENNKGIVYFNPNSADIAEQRLVISFNQMKCVHLSMLKNFLNHTLSEEVTSKVARKMLSNKL